MAAASTANRKYKRQESVRPDKLSRDVNSIAAMLPDKKEWIAQHRLQMLMLNGWVIMNNFHSAAYELSS